jgi:hypothetical protein
MRARAHRRLTMIDVEMVDKMFEASRARGLPVSWGLFDKRVLLPVGQLPKAVEQEAGETLTGTDLECHAAAGWFEPLLRDPPDSGLGTPLYIPSRIGLYVKLAREGHTAAELRAYATFEEWFVDAVLTNEEWPYIDDDLELLVAHYQQRVEGYTNGHRRDASGNIIDESAEHKKMEHQLAFLRRLQREGIDPRYEEVIAKHAFRARAIDDVMRTMQLNQDRDKIRAGYSPWVLCNGFSWSPKGGYEGEDIRWDGTIRTALANFDADAEPPIRVPGFLLRGARIVTLKTFRPGEYAAAWESLNLDGYLHAWSALKGERRCLQCLKPLPPDASPKRRFCDDACRNITRQRRFRERNPEGADRARKRYLESVEIDDAG